MEQIPVRESTASLGLKGPDNFRAQQNEGGLRYVPVWAVYGVAARNLLGHEAERDIREHGMRCFACEKIHYLAWKARLKIPGHFLNQRTRTETRKVQWSRYFLDLIKWTRLIYG